MNKFGPFEMGQREKDRRAWRAAVARAAEEMDCARRRWGDPFDTGYVMGSFTVAIDALDAALSAPKPWARARAGADLGDKWIYRTRARLRRKRRAAQRRGR